MVVDIGVQDYTLNSKIKRGFTRFVINNLDVYLNGDIVN